MSRKYKVLLLVILVVVAFVATRFWADESPVTKGDAHKDGIRFTQTTNDRGGNYWEYRLSNEKVIREIEHYNSRFFLNFGPAETQNWVFELVDAGEVTITWQEFEGGGFEGDSYEITYLFDEDGKYTVISDSREDVR